MTPTENTQAESQQPIDQAPADEQLRQLDDDRYVVSPNAVDSSEADDVVSAKGSATGSPTEAVAVPDVEALDGHFSLVAAARTGDGTESVSIDSNDVSRTFEKLLSWYAAAIAEDTPPEDVIDILLAHADVERSTER